MGLTELLIRVREVRRLRELVSEIAQRCHEALWNHVENRAVEMGSAEVRGYIWAKATELVEAEVNELLRHQQNLGDWARAELLVDARQQVVELVLVDALAAKTAWHLNRRRAA